MDRPVYVLGTGIQKFGRFTHLTHKQFAGPAVLEALKESKLSHKQIDVAYASSLFGGSMIGQQILGQLGLTGIPIINVENACSSSAVGVHEAAARIAAGRAEAAVVIGVDMLTKLGGGALPLNREDWDAINGLSMPVLYAMRAQRYIHEFGLKATDLSEVTVKARAHGARNPLAQFQKPVTLEEVNSSREVADPFRLLHCCPTGDGAAAVVLGSERLLKALGSGLRPVQVAGAALHSGKYHPGPYSMTTSHVSTQSAKEVYESAGVSPEDIDVAEIHDSFAIAELMYYEAFQFCKPGEALALLRSGATSLGGRQVVNPSGGLMSRGHPVAASGVAQIAEITRQLQGRSGAHQVKDARLGIAHVTGGGVSNFEHGACAVTLLKS
ncbi:thiolase family protein [Variovorax sp. MHTC-1]|uniref:thiolase family protein n=1 Tax=Variovorax sp. MHTC-1 TaxID=2495593 RepID=UPI000F876F8A|nr:thiolase family protein [Variovorax sp. MHTC-1]RST48481.1 thiolase family protein [Variovorax sp. MHTC-1]